MKQLILDTINAENVRPFTDLVKVSAPDPKPFDIDITYYIPKPRENSAALIQAELQKRLRNIKNGKPNIWGATLTRQN